MLDRIGAEDKASRELEEREDMNRKGGKLVSRIPTFQKRPSGALPTPELHVPKRDLPVHVAQPLDKSGSGGAEALKSKLTEIREKALPLPSVQTPKIGFEAEPSSTFAHSPVTTTPKSLYESGQYSSMIVSPRPALRPQQGSGQHLPEEDQSQTLEKGADNVLDAPDSQLPDQKPLEHTEEKCDVAVDSWITLNAYGDTKQSEDELHTTKVSDVAAIMDEQPPWEIQLKNPLEFKDSKCSSEAECEDDVAEEKSEDHDDEEEMKEHYEPLITKSEKSFNVDEATSPAAPEKPAESTKSTKVGRTDQSHCCLGGLSHTKGNSTTPCSNSCGMQRSPQLFSSLVTKAAIITLHVTFTMLPVLFCRAQEAAVLPSSASCPPSCCLSGGWVSMCGTTGSPCPWPSSRLRWSYTGWRACWFQSPAALTAGKTQSG